VLGCEDGIGEREARLARDKMSQCLIEKANRRDLSRASSVSNRGFLSRASGSREILIGAFLSPANGGGEILIGAFLSPASDSGEILIGGLLSPHRLRRYLSRGF